MEADSLLPNIFQPAIEPDLNVANPSAVILELSLRTVEGEPAIVAGVKIWSTVISPRTVKVLSINCKYWDNDLSPSNTAEPVISPVSFSFNISPTETVSSDTSNPPTLPPSS